MASSSRQTDATSIPAISSTGSYTIIPHNHKAKVWEHYDLVRMADGVEKARHKLCGSMYGSNGNSTLARHHTKCESKLNPEATQAQIDNTGHTWIYDQKLQRELQMKCIISREWPFNHFDNEDSTNYIQQGLQPKYHKVSRTTTRRDAVKCYLIVKKQLIKYFSKFEGKVSITSDVWTVGQHLNISYICITCHWIDLITVQASTVASESAFSLSGRVLNEKRSRLNPQSLEVCICYKDHLDAAKRVQDVVSPDDSSEEDDEVSLDAENDRDST